MIHHLEKDADLALFSGEIQLLVAALYRNERPLYGLAGLLDWRFRGLISDYIRSGFFSGEAGECIYLPLIHNDLFYHIMLLGVGDTDRPGTRKMVTQHPLQILHKNLVSLRNSRVAVSRTDFGNANDNFFSENLPEVPLWIVH
ncbi:MAG: hypothetical protein AABZ06_01760 [Bdellovibrionota bacterium]